MVGLFAHNPKEKDFEGPSNMLASMYLLEKTGVEMFDYKVYLLKNNHFPDSTFSSDGGIPMYNGMLSSLSY